MTTGDLVEWAHAILQANAYAYVEPATIRIARGIVESIGDVEIRKFYVRNCADSHGARVFAAVSDGPTHAVNDATRWTVYHRPEFDQRYPVKLITGLTHDEALRTAREFAAAYRR